jgi:hypothetical protein
LLQTLQLFEEEHVFGCLSKDGKKNCQTYRGASMHTLEEAMKNADPSKMDRWILRLGKNEEEAGKFEPWYMDASTFAEDFAGFLACLNLTKLVDQVEDRISVQKKGVRAAKKLQREAQKALDKAAAKAKREIEKAQLKLVRAAEKERIKADAKRVREEAKLAKRNMGRPEPDNALPGKAEDTSSEHHTDTTSEGDQAQTRTDVLTEQNVVSSGSDRIPETTPTVSVISVCEGIRSASEDGATNPSSPVAEIAGEVPSDSMVEAPVERKLFVIAEES